MTGSGHLTELTSGVRQGIENARDQATQNIAYLTKEIAKAEQEIERQRSKIEYAEEERATNQAALAQAEAMLNA